MDSKLISKLRGASWSVIVLGVLVCCYLLLSAAETQFVTNRQGELARIEAATNMAELKYEVAGVAMVANNASVVSKVLLSIAILALLIFVVLAGVSLHWLGRLERVINERSTRASQVSGANDP